LLRYDCYDCFEWRLNDTRCENCVPNCRDVNENFTDIYVRKTKTCYFEYFVALINDSSTDYNGQICKYVCVSSCIIFEPLDYEWSRSGTDYPQDRPKDGSFSKIVTVDLRQIDNPIKFSTIYDDCNEDIRNVTIFDQQQIAVTGCTYNAYCTGDRCNIQSNDMFEKEPVVSS